ncbi:3'5'-cyclic nucleotide phosphodiesterase domain-containing protein [Toxoplasma gondii ME49]|uniref:3'5'-cyclic nucleotide phosphodiesterase domain-containing protein n=1 Tax=Toxoplasma gondii (strain ATCC 50611 / Me49) TaxID=508771 RepID=S8F358_TOXGM|nr:3'5'-cyclic nucleotide phosphodiesterase domain-containing protein [Toxoplasma gondii ME49]EPT29092.1 3'5'-cyclic nucleotide phosphodiesterase domain-containing protein [Toxoplasma gondii ME49]|eukprot:XP_018636910.1 3'5'-cyclic nucleotide phosphodiesterase domain-containing protein [Toxoplasma gondii ME49]
MWFYSYLRHPNDVPSLCTHIRSSNIFLRLGPQYYLPEDERKSLFVRTCHLLYYLASLLFLTTLTTYTAIKIPSSPSTTTELLSQLFPFNSIDDCNERLSCKVDCVLYAFPDLNCAKDDGSLLTFGGNSYSSLYFYHYPGKDVPLQKEARTAWERCYQIMRETTGRLQFLQQDRETVERTHTCFAGCKTNGAVTFTQKLTDGTPVVFDSGTDWLQMAPAGSLPQDTRPACNPSEPPSLLCVEPTDECQHVTLRYQVCIGDTAFCFDIVRILITIALGVVWNVVLDAFVVWAMSIDDSDPQNLGRVASKCGLQIIATAIIVSSFFCLVASMTRILSMDANIARHGTLWTSFVLVIIIDQLFSFLFSVLIWYAMLRRCGRQLPDESRFQYKIHPSPVLVKLKKATRKIVNYNGFEMFFTMLLGWMVVDLTCRMILCQFFFDETAFLNQADRILEVVDFIILILFIVEICLRIAADGLKIYFSDPINCIDFFLVFFGFGIRIVDFFIQINKGIGNVLFIMRLVRLYRLHRPPTGSLAIGKKEVFTSRVERIIAVLNKALEIEELTTREKDSLKWLIQTISSGKLYEMGSEEKKKTDSHVQAWISIISTQSQSANQMADDMENILLERVKQMTKAGDAETDMPAVLQLEYGIDVSLDHAIEGYLANNLITWNFDVFRFHVIAGRAALPKLFVRCLQHQEVCSLFNLKIENMLRFAMELEKTSFSTTPFHNSIRSAEVLQAMHLFLAFFDTQIKGFFNSREILAALLAAVVWDYQHPGFSSAFLIKTQHAIAIRYNDRNVLEHHHVAAAFSLMQKLGENDPLLAFPEDQYIALRKIIIQLSQSGSRSNQTACLSLLKTKLQQAEFPRSITEDKNIILCNLMNAANYSFLGRPLQLYLQWSQKYMEELFMQGDRELELDMPITKNCDRHTTSEAVVQLGLIDGWAIPIYITLAQTVPKLNAIVVSHLRRNRLHWLDEQQEEDKSKEKQTKVTPIKRYSKTKQGSTEATGNGELSKPEATTVEIADGTAGVPELRASANPLSEVD